MKSIYTIKDLDRFTVDSFCLVYYNMIKKGEYMIAAEREVVPGLTSAEVKEIADQVFNRTDGNHPQLSVSGNGFINILQNGKPDISASPVFVRKVCL